MAQGGKPSLLVKLKDGRVRLVKFAISPGKVGQDTSIASLKKILGLGVNDNLVFKSAARRAKGEYKTLQQFFKRTKVEFSHINVHSQQGSLSSVSGDYTQLPENFSVRPALSEKQGLQKATAAINSKK